MKKRLFALIAAVLCLGSTLGQQSLMGVSYYFGHLYLHSKINGHPASLVFDTGSPYTCMDSTFLADSGIEYKNIWKAEMDGAGNDPEIVRIIVDELTYTVNEKEYQSHIAPIIQLKSILGDYADGILGIDNMGGKVVAINYLDEQMGFWDQLGDTAGFTSIPIRHILIDFLLYIKEMTVSGLKKTHFLFSIFLNKCNSRPFLVIVLKVWKMKQIGGFHRKRHSKVGSAHKHQMHMTFVVGNYAIAIYCRILNLFVRIAFLLI